MRFHILAKVSRKNDQFSTKFKSKVIVSFPEGSGKYKLIKCKSDSFVACTLIDSFSFSFFSLLFWLLATKYIGEKKKTGNVNRSEKKETLHDMHDNKTNVQCPSNQGSLLSL